MELNAAKELKLIGSVGSAHFRESIDRIELSGGSIELAAPVDLDVKYSYDGEGFTIEGRLSSSVRMNCTKCDSEFIEEFAVDFSERFMRVSEAEAEENDCYPFFGETLVLDKMAEDLILLNAPRYGLCRPDCKGLCPVCGTNLNYTQCSCKQPDDSNPFAVLKGLAELLKEDQED